MTSPYEIQRIYDEIAQRFAVLNELASEEDGTVGAPPQQDAYSRLFTMSCDEMAAELWGTRERLPVLTETDVRAIALAALNEGDYSTTWELFSVEQYVDDDVPTGTWSVSAQDLNHASNIIGMDVRPDGTVEDIG